MKIVIIGGVAAGAKVAAKSKRLLPDSEIYIYTQDKYVSYSACGLPYYIEGNFEDWRKLIIRSVEEFENSGIHIRTLHKVTKILTADKKIVVKDLLSQEIKFIDYDKLVIATGAYPYMKDFPEINLKNIFTLRTLDDGIAIREAMQNVTNITLIGGGYISIELLEAFVKNGKNVTLIEKAPYILSVFDEDIASLIQNYILENSNGQVKLVLEDTLKEFVGDETVKGVLTAKGSGFETEMVVISAGVGRTPQIIVITIATFLIMTVTIYQGVINVDETLIKAARVLGAKDKDIFFKVIAPATLPFIITAIRLGSSTALTTLIAAESTGAVAGLGMRIRSLNNSFESEPMLLYIIIIGIIGLLVEKFVKYLERRFTGWQEKREV